MLLLYPAANRDESVFAEPQRFDVTRQPNPHVAFGGYGAHFCLGASLARLELRVMFEELMTHAPVLEAGQRRAAAAAPVELHRRHRAPAGTGGVGEGAASPGRAAASRVARTPLPRRRGSPPSTWRRGTRRSAARQQPACTLWRIVPVDEICSDARRARNSLALGINTVGGYGSVVPKPRSAPRRSADRKIPSASSLLVALLVLARQGGAYIPQFAAWVDGLGVWGPVVFIVGYAGGGGRLRARLGADPRRRRDLRPRPGRGRTSSSPPSSARRRPSWCRATWRAAPSSSAWPATPRFAAIDRAVGAQGRKIVFLLRLSPVFPFTLLNYALGLTRVRFVDYLVASIGMLPGTLLYVYYGKLAGDVAALAGGAAVEKGAGYYAVLVARARRHRAGDRGGDPHGAQGACRTWPA